MQVWNAIAVLLLAYLVGSIPMGLITVKLATGEDVRHIQSGRTGGTNAMRAAGFWIGLLTSFLDIAKGIIAVWLAKTLTPGAVWLEVFAPAINIIGHNYSIYLIRRDESGRIRWRGGAGGAPALGGAVAYWPPLIFILVPVGALILFGIGFASVATLSIPVIAAIVFGIRAYLDLSPWQYLVYCLLAEILIIWSLRPNLKRLLGGTERVVGWRAKRVNAQRESKNSPNQVTSLQ